MRVSRRTALFLAAPLVPIIAGQMTLAQAQPSAAAAAGASNYVAQTLALGALAKAQSQVALERGTDPNVKTFAELEIAEQDAVAGVLTAAGGGDTQPQLTPEQQATINQLAGMQPGQDFDLAYIEAQITGHTELLSVQQTMSGGTEPSIEGITARLAEQAVASHIATLNLIQELIGVQHIRNVEESEDQQAAPEAQSGKGQ